MTAVQNFSVPQGDDLDVVFTVDPADQIDLTAAGVVWRAYEMQFAVPVMTQESGGVPVPASVVSKDSATGGVTILESPGQFVVHLNMPDTALLPTGNYYHEAEVTDASGNNATVCHGAMAVTLAIIP
jgi:hypothetical protein